MIENRIGYRGHRELIPAYRLQGQEEFLDRINRIDADFFRHGLTQD
jgi:hypothetical protein